MNVEIKDFVGVFSGAFSDAFCEEAIKVFDDAEAMGFTRSRIEHENVEKLRKDDKSFFISGDSRLELKHTISVGNEFVSKFWADIYPPYIETYGINSDFGPLRIYNAKIQRTPIGGGYHVWHWEDSTREICTRVMSFILYLNDVDEGGETEFLFYSRRIKPTKGTLILFPAGYTHTHRGNPPISNTKYIITGWVEV